MAVRSRSSEELVFESPHGRLGSFERPLITIRRGSDNLLIEDRGGGPAEPMRLAIERAEAVRLVPSPANLSGGHLWRRPRPDWCLTIRFKNGQDLILEQGLEASEALGLAESIQALCGLGLDEYSRRLFGVAEQDA